MGRTRTTGSRQMRALGVVCALSLVAGTAEAGQITWVATGTVNFGNFLFDLPLTPQVGDTFVYTITYDDASVDTDASAESGNFPDAIQSASLSIGGMSIDLPVGPGS